MARIRAIGVVRSSFTEPADPFEMREHESTIVVRPEYAEGLYRIEESRCLQILFHLHRSRGYTLIGKRRGGEEKGVFACRSPHRPGGIGLSTVELLRRDGRELTVKGLDALDGTPVLDIKPYVAAYDTGAGPEGPPVEPGGEGDPRSAIRQLVGRKDLRALLERTATLHGHFCPGVSLGVVAAVHGLHRLAELRRPEAEQPLESDGMEELLAVVETNSCFADGVQFVTGCTLGNNALIYRDLGKTAVTLCDRSGRGVRLAARPGYGRTLDTEVPEYRRLFDEVVRRHDREPERLRRFKAASRKAGFALLQAGAEELFAVGEVTVAVPDYAPIRESAVCLQCGESVMGGKTVGSDDEPLCRSCAEAAVATLSGAGILCPEETSGRGTC